MIILAKIIASKEEVFDPTNEKNISAMFNSIPSNFRLNQIIVSSNPTSDDEDDFNQKIDRIETAEETKNQNNLNEPFRPLFYSNGDFTPYGQQFDDEELDIDHPVIICFLYIINFVDFFKMNLELCLDNLD